MTKDYCKERFETLEEELLLYAELGGLPVRRLSGALNSINKAMDELKDQVLAAPFADHAAEIHFFKHEKPRFTAERVYALEIYAIETNRPQQDRTLIIEFYKKELSFVERFFSQYQFLYSYYQMDATELDHLFFLRNASPSAIFLPDTPALDPAFATAADYHFGKFMAYQRLREFILAELRTLEPAGENTNPPGTPAGTANPNLKWTGETINLVEVAYGIWLTKQLNDGNATLTDIVAWLETSLQAHIGRPHRRFMEIERRKILSQTRYLDQQREAIQRKIEESMTIN